jgi:hypothetical protein
MSTLCPLLRKERKSFVNIARLRCRGNGTSIVAARREHKRRIDHGKNLPDTRDG